MDGHLREILNLSKKFTEIARLPVRVYMNNRNKRYELWHRGHCIVGILDQGLDGSVPRVRDHFRKVRSGYYLSRELRDKVRRCAEDGDRQWEKALDDKSREDAADLEKALRCRVTVSGL